MVSFDEVCSRFEQMSGDERGYLLVRKASEVAQRFVEATEDAQQASQLLGLFVVGAIMADNELSPDEYAFMRRGYESLGLNTTFPECESMLKLAKYSMDKVTDDLSDMIAVLDDTLAGDLLLVCLALCSIDGVINAAEREWIIKLFS